jgi:hypothetical protein
MSEERKRFGYHVTIAWLSKVLSGGYCCEWPAYVELTDKVAMRESGLDYADRVISDAPCVEQLKALWEQRRWEISEGKRFSFEYREHGVVVVGRPDFVVHSCGAVRIVDGPDDNPARMRQTQIKLYLGFWDLAYPDDQGKCIRGGTLDNNCHYMGDDSPLLKYRRDHLDLAVQDAVAIIARLTDHDPKQRFSSRKCEACQLLTECGTVRRRQ